MPSPTVTPEAVLRILALKSCTVYLRAASMAEVIDRIVHSEPAIRTVTAPEPEELMRDTPATPILYEKSWKEGKTDPWLVFHTSGTTGTRPYPLINIYDEVIFC